MALSAVEISNSASTVALNITQNANSAGVQVTNAGSTNALLIDQNGTASTSTSVGGAVLIENTGNTGAGLVVYTNAGASSGTLVNIRADNSSFDQKVLNIDNDGTGRGVSIVSAGTAASLFVDPNGATSTSTSVGGAILLENTGNDGAGLVIYSNNGASATGRLMNIRADNAAFANAALHVDYDGTANAVEISSASTDSSSQALNVVSTNPNDSTMGVNGEETGKGTVKIVHTGTGTDSSASGLSIDLQGTGTASQGIFVDSTATGGTSGDLMKLRNETDLKFVVKSSGAMGIKDGITAPSAATGMALIYVDVADGDLKVKFADGTTKTLATDT